MVKMVNNLPLELFILGSLEREIILKELLVIPYDYTYNLLFKKLLCDFKKSIQSLFLLLSVF